jgi:hypothetical protein
MRRIKNAYGISAILGLLVVLACPSMLFATAPVSFAYEDGATTVVNDGDCNDVGGGGYATQDDIEPNIFSKSWALVTRMGDFDIVDSVAMIPFEDPTSGSEEEQKAAKESNAAKFSQIVIIPKVGDPLKLTVADVNGCPFKPLTDSVRFCAEPNTGVMLYISGGEFLNENAIVPMLYVSPRLSNVDKCGNEKLYNCSAKEIVNDTVKITITETYLETLKANAKLTTNNFGLTALSTNMEMGLHVIPTAPTKPYFLSHYITYNKDGEQQRGLCAEGSQARDIIEKTVETKHSQ